MGGRVEGAGRADAPQAVTLAQPGGSLRERLVGQFHAWQRTNAEADQPRPTFAGALSAMRPSDVEGIATLLGSTVSLDTSRFTAWTRTIDLPHLSRKIAFNSLILNIQKKTEAPFYSVDVVDTTPEVHPSNSTKSFSHQLGRVAIVTGDTSVTFLRTVGEKEYLALTIPLTGEVELQKGTEADLLERTQHGPSVAKALDIVDSMAES